MLSFALKLQCSTAKLVGVAGVGVGGRVGVGGGVGAGGDGFIDGVKGDAFIIPRHMSWGLLVTKCAVIML